MTLPQTIAWLLAGGALLASLRLLWRWRRADTARPRAWRVGFLLGAQALAAVLLYRTLFPPSLAAPAATLVVLSADAAKVRTALPPGRLVALPEATQTATQGVRLRLPAAQGSAVRVPDLATALRRHPDTRTLIVIGAGLEPRDIAAADAATSRGVALHFQPAPLPRAIVELQPPQPVPSGRAFLIRGTAHDVAGGSIELLDPAGRRVDQTVLDAQGGFALHGASRVPGPALFTLRLRDAKGAVIERLPVPQRTLDTRPLRVLALAGAPEAELKFLRRWALDADISLSTRISLGAGMRIHGGTAALDTAALDRLDLLLVDARSWAGLDSASRSRVLAAVNRGLGLLLRLDAATGTRERGLLRPLGFGATSTPAKPVRLGAGFVRAGDAVDALPALSRAALQPSASDAVTALTDGGGNPLALWRPHARGRIGVSVFDDSYRLVLAGRSDAHAELWSRLASAVARAQADGRPLPQIEPAAPGNRSIVCGLNRGAQVITQVIGPDGGSRTLQRDPGSGADACAGFWAQTWGWHLLRSSGSDDLPFHVPDPATGRGLHAKALRDQTRSLVSDGAPATQADTASTRLPGPRWPWFIGWLVVIAASWWLERSRRGLLPVAE